MTAPRFELASQRQMTSRLPTEPPGRPVDMCDTDSIGGVISSNVVGVCFFCLLIYTFLCT